MQSIIARLGGGAAVLALTVALTLAPASATAQAGTSFSNAVVSDLSNNGNNSNSCGHSSTSSMTLETTSAVANCGPVLGGTASATTSSSNAGRTASAQGTVNQTGTQGQTFANGHSFSDQYSQLAVTGTPSPTDNLVFHFLTTQFETGDVNSNSGYGFWNLTVVGGTDDPVFAQQTAGGNLLHSAATQQTSQGFDFTMLLTPTSGLFKYNFTVDAYGYITGHASGNTTQTGSISAMLAGIDVVDGSGAPISSATFDPQTGFGTINAAPDAGPPSTVPEPSSMALFGTGLVGLAGFRSRRRKRV